MKVSLATAFVGLTLGCVSAQKSRIVESNIDYQDHYLVGLLNLPNSYVDPKLRNHTSGKLLNGVGGSPYNYIPSVGFSDIEFAYTNGSIVRGEFFCLSDNGFGSPANSEDYALNIARMRIQKPFTFRHGGGTVEPYTKALNLNSALIHDPNNLIRWENGADIQVTYAIPDATWNDYKALRVLTGRDFDVEGMAVINENFAILGDELMPAIFAVNPTTGVVLSPFVRTPDIDSMGNFNGKFLSTRGDKVHCNMSSLALNTCKISTSAQVDASIYRRHDASGGFEGFSRLADGTIAAFIEKNTGDTTLVNEPGVRVYKVLPGSGTAATPPKFDSFMGFYPFEIHGTSIADVSAIPGSSRFVAVIERNGFPSQSGLWPINVLPHNYLCIVDLLRVNRKTKVMNNKKCILNYQRIDDPWDVDGNGITRAAFIQQTNEQLIVVDDNCIVAGTDTNFPFFNDFAINMTVLPFGQEVSDSRWMVVCFQEAIFHVNSTLFKGINEKGLK